GLFENELIPGIEDLLAELVNDGRQLAVATSKPEPFARTIVEHFGIADYFAVVAGATLDHRRRHKDQIVLHALEHLALPEPPTVGMVGDREDAGVGAMTNEFDASGVLWGYG